MFDAVTYILAKNAAKKYIDETAASIEWEPVIVDEVPDPAEAEFHTMYFVPIDPEDTSKGYIEYIKINESTIESLGSTTVNFEDLGIFVDLTDDELLIFHDGYPTSNSNGEG